MDVLMPQLGETVAEGKITKWFKSAGDAVKPGDNLFEIETDKVSMEVPAIAAGMLAEIRVQAGDVAPVGAVVAIIAGEGGAAASAPAAKARRRSTATKPHRSRPLTVRSRASGNPGPRTGSPLSRGRAGGTSLAYPNLDPFFEVRTPARNFGPANRRAARPSRRWRAGSPARTASICRALSRLRPAWPHRRARRREARSAAARARRARDGGGRVGRAGQGALPGRRVRGSAARRHAPHHRGAAGRGQADHPALLSHRRRDDGRAAAVREDANAGAPKAGEAAAYKLSVNDFVIKALALALQRVPAANAVWAGDRILRFKHSDVGVAVAIDGGLLTPVIRNAEAKSLSAISNEMRELAGRARDKKLKPARIPGRRVGDLQSRHVRRARVLGDHQPAAVDHPCGRRRRSAVRSRRRTAP